MTVYIHVHVLMVVLAHDNKFKQSRAKDIFLSPRHMPRSTSALVGQRSHVDHAERFE